MNIALLAVRFIARLRRRVNTVLRPILGKRKLRTVRERTFENWRRNSFHPTFINQYYDMLLGFQEYRENVMNN